jgi:hypothetical protein
MTLQEEVADKCEKDTIKAFSGEMIDDEATMLARAERIQKTFQSPRNKELKEWFLIQLCQYRLVDKKTDMDPQIKHLVFRELAGMFQFLTTPIKEVKLPDEADRND